MITIRIGVDTGLLGGISVMHNGELTIYGMPLTSEIEPDAYAIAKIVDRFDRSTTRVTIEGLHGFEKLHGSKASIATQFANYGKTIGAFEALGFNVELIEARSWQTAAEKKRLDSKEESIVKAIEFYPHAKEQLLKGKSRVVFSDGKAESLLVLHWQFVDEAKKLKKKKKA